MGPLKKSKTDTQKPLWGFRLPACDSFFLSVCRCLGWREGRGVCREKENSHYQVFFVCALCLASLHKDTSECCTLSGMDMAQHEQHPFTSGVDAAASQSMSLLSQTQQDEKDDAAGAVAVKEAACQQDTESPAGAQTERDLRSWLEQHYTEQRHLGQEHDAAVAERQRAFQIGYATCRQECLDAIRRLAREVGNTRAWKVCATCYDEHTRTDCTHLVGYFLFRSEAEMVRCREHRNPGSPRLSIEQRLVAELGDKKLLCVRVDDSAPKSTDINDSGSIKHTASGNASHPCYNRLNRWIQMVKATRTTLQTFCRPSMF